MCNIRYCLDCKKELKFYEHVACSKCLKIESERVLKRRDKK